MEELLSLLKDGRARSVEMLAIELGTTVEDIRRKLEYLEQMNIIRKVSLGQGSCGSCSGCSDGSGKQCKSCMPEGGFKNMGEMWEVIR